MHLPVILRADDGISWWSDSRSLELSLESPDIEDGMYSAWDALGQVLRVLPLEPVKRGRFFGLKTVTVTSGRLAETGEYDSGQLVVAIHEHLSDRFPSIPLSGMNLEATVGLLQSLQSDGVS